MIQETRVARILMIRQGQVGIKVWILKPCSKVLWQAEKVSDKFSIFTDQFGSLPSWTQQKHLVMLNCALHKQNFVKFLTHPCTKTIIFIIVRHIINRNLVTEEKTNLDSVSSPTFNSFVTIIRDGPFVNNLFLIGSRKWRISYNT